MTPQTHAEEYLKALYAHLDEEIGRANKNASWYKADARSAKIKYYSLRVPLIIFAITLPQLTVMQTTFRDVAFLPVVTAGIALLIAILTALDTFFRFGDTWAEERAAELAIYSLMRKYLDKSVRIQFLSPSEENIKEAEGIIESFRNEFEQIVGQVVIAKTQRAKAGTATILAQSPKE